MMVEGKFSNESIEMTEQQKKAQRARNVALALALAAFVVLLYFATWTKFGANLLQQ